MNDLNRCGSFKSFLWFPSQSFSRKHYEQRSATFSTRSEHVLDDLVGLTSVKIRLQRFVDHLLDRIAPGFKRRWKLSHFREPSMPCHFKCLRGYLIGCGQHRKPTSNCM